VTIEESETKAKQGGRGLDIFVILVVSTVLAALALWGLFSLFAADNTADQAAGQTAIERSEAAGVTAEEAVDVVPGTETEAAE